MEQVGKYRAPAHSGGLAHVTSAQTSSRAYHQSHVRDAERFWYSSIYGGGASLTLDQVVDALIASTMSPANLSGTPLERLETKRGETKP